MPPYPDEYYLAECHCENETDEGPDPKCERCQGSGEVDTRDFLNRKEKLQWMDD